MHVIWVTRCLGPSIPSFLILLQLLAAAFYFSEKDSHHYLPSGTAHHFDYLFVDVSKHIISSCKPLYKLQILTSYDP